MPQPCVEPWLRGATEYVPAWPHQNAPILRQSILLAAEYAAPCDTHSTLNKYQHNMKS